jgi:hypothetical protein
MLAPCREGYKEVVRRNCWKISAQIYLMNDLVVDFPPSSTTFLAIVELPLIQLLSLKEQVSSPYEAVKEIVSNSFSVI